jgi:hypothetical protein
MYKSPDIVTEIKVRRLEWLGHVVRMEDTHLPKMVFNAKPEGRRGVGRPRLRWLDDVEADIKALGIKRWGIIAQDRKQERALPVDLHSRKLSSYPPLLNVESHTTIHFLFSVSSASRG